MESDNTPAVMRAISETRHDDDHVVQKLRQEMYGRVSTSTSCGPVMVERIRAHQKHRDGGQSMELVGWDDLLAWTTVLGEEVGEIDKAINEWRHGNLTDEEFREELEKEVVQTAAMCLAWIDAFGAD